MDEERTRYIVCPYGAHNLVAKMTLKRSELKILVADKMREAA